MSLLLTIYGYQYRLNQNVKRNKVPRTQLPMYLNIISPNFGRKLLLHPVGTWWLPQFNIYFRLNIYDSNAFVLRSDLFFNLKWNETWSILRIPYVLESSFPNARKNRAGVIRPKTDCLKLATLSLNDQSNPTSEVSCPWTRETPLPFFSGSWIPS